MACLVESELIESVSQMSEYRVALRHTTLLESAALEAKGDDRYFIATAAPPPTNSILTLHQAEAGENGEKRERPDAPPQFFVVDSVFEVEGEGRVRGVLGKLTDAQAHEAASMLGTEHLDDGQAPPEDHTPAMAMPAPVVDPDLDDGEPNADELERLEVESDAQPRTDGEDADAAAEESGGSKRGRRRNRKRR